MEGDEFEYRKAMLEPGMEEQFTTVLMSILAWLGSAKGIDKHAEFFYELEESKKYFPCAWADAEEFLV